MHNIAKLLKTEFGNLIKRSHARTSESARVTSSAACQICVQTEEREEEVGGGLGAGKDQVSVWLSPDFSKSTTANLIES